MTNIKSTKRALVSSVMALFLCFAMLLGTTFAWFTDSVTSSNNVIQTGELKIGFQWADGKEDPTAANWADVNGAIFDYANWEPGYAVAKHLKVSNKGTLALNYQMRIVADGIVTKLADVINVYVIAGADVKALTRADLDAVEPIGTLTEVLGTSKNLSNYIYGSLEAGAEADIYTIVLKMDENANDDYQNMDLGCTFSVELIATQMAYESDSFDEKYDDDTNVPNPAVPAALVRALKGDDLNVSLTWGIGGAATQKTLDTAYQFEPTISYEDAQKSEYRYWHADFVVYADKDVPADSMALAGYYDAWCSLNNYNWVALTADTEIAASTEIRLVSSMGDGFYVNWEEICNYGNDGLGFQCGAVDLTGENAGTTLTVELRLYETTKDWNAGSGTANVETGNYIIVEKFVYTFPATGVTNQSELDNAIANDDDVVISLGAGNYTLPSTNGKTVEIIGTEDTVIDVTGGYYADQANLTFKGVTFSCTMDNANGGDYELLYSPNVTFVDCTFNGAHGVGRDGASYIGCTFNLPVDYVWSFANDTVFDGCTFNSQGKALLLYNHGGTEMVNVTVKNCVFNATQGATAYAIANQNCAAIEIDNYGCSFNLITENNTVDTEFSGEWRIKSFYGNGNTVTVNGTEYTTIAIDGKTMTIDADRNVTVNN